MAGLAIEQLAQGQKARILAIDLAGMDAALTKTTGSLRCAADCASSAPLVETIKAFIGLPSGVVPNWMQRTACG